MAFDVSTIKNTVMGDMRVKILSMVPDGAEESFDTGLEYIYGFSCGHASMATGSPGIHMNCGTTSTAAYGYLGVSGVASGDILILTVFGR